MKKFILSFLLLLITNISFAYSERNTIQEIYADGEIIRMIDGSMYKINGYDMATSCVWVPMTEVVITDYKIINIDDGESVEYLKRIK